MSHLFGKRGDFEGGIRNNFGGFPGGSEDKESAFNAGDTGLIPGLE